jgi:hypothetical protein
VKYTACLTFSRRYIARYLILENFSCTSNKSVALALLAKFIAVLVSKMEFFSVPAPNACIGLVLDLFGHFPLYVIIIASIKAWCTLKLIALIINIAMLQIYTIEFRFTIGFGNHEQKRQNSG